MPQTNMPTTMPARAAAPSFSTWATHTPALTPFSASCKNLAPSVVLLGSRNVCAEVIGAAPLLAGGGAPRAAHARRHCISSRALWRQALRRLRFLWRRARRDQTCLGRGPRLARRRRAPWSTLALGGTLRLPLARFAPRAETGSRAVAGDRRCIRAKAAAAKEPFCATLRFGYGRRKHSPPSCRYLGAGLPGARGCKSFAPGLGDTGACCKAVVSQ